MVGKKTWESCGMSLKDTSQHGGKDVNNPYCVYCTDETGNSKSREEVREGMIGFFMKSENKTRGEAEKFVDKHMRKMPAWKK
jgi:hypothetical protein